MAPSVICKAFAAVAFPIARTPPEAVEAPGLIELLTPATEHDVPADPPQNKTLDAPLKMAWKNSQHQHQCRCVAGSVRHCAERVGLRYARKTVGALKNVIGSEDHTRLRINAVPG